MEVFIWYLSIGLVIGQFGALCTASAWAKTYKQTMSDNWMFFTLAALGWPLCLDLWFDHNTPLTRGEISREDLAKHWD